MVVSAHRNGYLDQPTFNLLKEVSSEVPIVQINAFSDYEFNEELYKLGQWVLADFLELGANDWGRQETLVFGYNSHKFKKAQTEEWQKFDKFVRDKPPILTLKREFLSKDGLWYNIYPIDFPCFHSPQPIQTKEEFEARKIEVFHFWGFYIHTINTRSSIMQ